MIETQEKTDVKCYTFTIRSLFEGRNKKRPVLSLVGDGRIPQLEGDHEIGTSSSSSFSSSFFPYLNLNSFSKFLF